jgi:predicted GNAT family N-acyltransferase
MGQDAAKDLARPYVLVSNGGTGVSGYYTLSCTNIPTEDLPEEIKKRIRYGSAPAILLGRLAVAEELQGQKLGRLMLMDALKRSLGVSRSAAATGVLVDAKDEQAARFYEHHGFIRFKDNPLRLYLPMKTVRELFEAD